MAGIGVLALVGVPKAVVQRVYSNDYYLGSPTQVR